MKNGITCVIQSGGLAIKIVARGYAERGLSSGVRTGAYGAISGAAIGGILGGFDALSNGRKFWTGKGVSISELSARDYTPSKDGKSSGIKDKTELNKQASKDFPGYEKYTEDLDLNNNTFMAKQGYRYDPKTGYIYHVNSPNERLLGLTINAKTSVIGNSKNYIWVSKNYINIKSDYLAIVGHELIHAYHYSTGYIDIYGSDASEHIAHSYSSSVAGHQFSQESAFMKDFSSISYILRTGTSVPIMGPQWMY
jgi:hypothetical protein